MNKIILAVFRFLLFFGLVGIFFGSIQVLAVEVTTSSGVPSSVFPGQEFILQGQLREIKVGEKYWVKCRIGTDDSHLTEGETYNSNSSLWLYDSGEWVKMPLIEATAQTMDFSLVCRVKTTAIAGDKLLYLRVCLQNTEGKCGGDIFQSTSPVSLRVETQSLPTPSPTESEFPLPSVTVTPTTEVSASYKINEVKDEKGTVLSSVKIYLDGIYIHHYTPETIKFCQGCLCDQQVNCGFGEHQIKLEKSGFETWEEKRLIEMGKSYQVDPVMKAVTPTATSKPSPYYSPTVFKKETEALRLTPTKILETEVLASEEAKMDKGATLAGLILGEENLSDEAEKQNEEEKPKRDYIGYFLIGGGGLLLLVASWPWVKKFLEAKKRY